MKSQLTSANSSAAKATETMKWEHSASLPQLAKKEEPSLIEEVYDSILWRLEAKRYENKTLAVGLTGCLGKSGASTIAANLAVRASRQQRGRILLIDANWEMPGLLSKFNLMPESGLYDILSGEVSPRECEPQSVAENLDVLCRGTRGDDQLPQSRRELVEEMLSGFKAEYSLILVDLPAAAEMRNALPLARQLDGSLLIARFEAVKQSQAQQSLERLQENEIVVWGTILNRHREYVPKWLRKLL